MGCLHKCVFCNYDFKKSILGHYSEHSYCDTCCYDQIDQYFIDFQIFLVNTKVVNYDFMGTSISPKNTHFRSNPIILLILLVAFIQIILCIDIIEYNLWE